jgi:threonyl-tRNA synthetase
MESLETKRHSLAHIMAAAIKEMWPQVQMTIGPAIETGFYYDIDLQDEKINETDLKKIEKKMSDLIKQDLKFEKQEKEIRQALKEAKIEKNPYKQEIIEELKNQGEKLVSFYTVGQFTDLCRGPHIKSTGKINLGSFKLDRLAGAYWHGDEKNKMLTRIYGLAFDNKKELDEYLKIMVEAKKRDHRKLGKELDLFCFSNLVGPGLPLYTPKGTIIIDELRNHIENVCRRYGFEKVMTPHLAKMDLYEISGHAKKFSDELFHVSSIKGHKFVMKPVQCPHQTQIYASKTRSYRDLPIRYMESERQYRAEKTGEVSGLSRVYAITVEDGHTFCQINQVKEELKNLVNIIKNFYSALGLWGKHWVSLSVRDYDHPEKYIGEKADWDICEKMLEEVSKEMNLDAKRREGEAALYGPKLDFMFHDSLGKEVQIPTVQLDFATPKRFNLIYIDKDGQEKNPVMIHRAILGSYERFLALIIEHFAGAFPVWLSPVQAKIISVGEAHIPVCQKLAKEMRDNNIRVEVDENNETISNKIRKAIAEKIPYTLIIGDKEAGSDNLSVRDRGQKETRTISKTEFIAEVKEKIVKKSLS